MQPMSAGASQTGVMPLAYQSPQVQGNAFTGVTARGAQPTGSAGAIQPSVIRTGVMTLSPPSQPVQGNSSTWLANQSAGGSGGSSEGTSPTETTSTAQNADQFSPQEGGGGLPFVDHSGSAYFKQLQEYKRDYGGQALNQQMFNGGSQ
jgi:hypothetical protein